MKLALISDVHANLEALEACLRDIEGEGVDRIYCLGDVIGYGPDPRQVADRVREVCAGIVRGNHEEIVTRAVPRRIAPIAARAAFWTRRKLEPRSPKAPPKKVERWHTLRKLPTTIEVPDEGLLLAHGTPEDCFSYVLSVGDALRVFRRQLPASLPVCFIGHTHVPGFFFYDGRQIGFGLAEEGRRFEFGSHRLLVNAGSVGQPRDQDPRACYAIWHGDGSFEFRRVEYDVETTCRKIHGIPELPNALADRLLIGE